MLFWFSYKTKDNMTDLKTGKHGGVRPNSGRKPLYDEETTVIRVPVSKKALVKNFLKQTLDNTGSAVVPFPMPGHDLNAELALRPVQALTYYQIPVAQELIPAGFPSPAEDHIEDVLDLNEHLIRNKSATFVGRVGSLSMRDAGFDVGDEILIDRSIEARHKDVVIAMIDNKFTMKRLMLCEYDTKTDEVNPDNVHDCDRPENAGKSLSDALQEFHGEVSQQPIWFKAENPDFKNIYPEPGQTIVIIGVVTYNIKKVINR